MEIIRTVARMQSLARRLREERKRIGLVPTRGQLHDGHLAIVRKTQQLSDVTIVTTLSNPVGQSEKDEESRSKILTQDVELLVPTDINYVFAPRMDEFDSPDASTEVIVRGLTERLFGSVRHGYYSQTARQMVELLNITNPDIVGLGRKDPQLVAVVKQLVADLHFSCQILVVPIVREQDGVAASRWLYVMDEKDRQAATLIYKALEKTQVLFGAGERDASDLIKAMREILEPEPRIQPEYLGVVDEETLEPIASIDDTQALVAISATIGEAHLIDNIILNE